MARTSGKPASFAYLCNAGERITASTEGFYPFAILRFYLTFR